MYSINPIQRKIREAIMDLRPAHRQKLKEAFSDIEREPHYHPAGKIGRLKADLACLGYHYRLTNAYRVHYEINEQARTVEITYIGPHPNY